MCQKLHNPTITIFCIATIGLITVYGTIHYYTTTCHINNCTIDARNICGTRESSYICYIVNVTYNLSLLNGTHIYTQHQSGIVTDRAFCNYTSLVCYYDDRDIAQSLRLLNKYTLSIESVIIIILIGLVPLVSAAGIEYSYHKNNPETNLLLKSTKTIVI